MNQWQLFILQNLDIKTMTPKEKANELIDKYISVNGSSFFAKECAIIVVDEMIKEFKNSDSLYATKFLADYWQSVKTELEKLK